MSGFIGFSYQDATIQESTISPVFKSSEKLAFEYLQHNSLRFGFASVSNDGKTNQDDIKGQFSVSKCKKHAICLNGTIYNNIELREELEKQGCIFDTGYDSEILLNGLIKEKLDFLPKINGMFSLIYIDLENNWLFLIKDGFGTKPLFYTIEENSLLFSTELTALIKSLNKPIKPDLQQAYDYLVQGIYDSNEQTFIEDIYRMMPAHYLKFDLEKFKLVETKEWWTPSINTQNVSFEEAQQKVRQLFLENIKLHLRNTNKIGCTLSGGIDSSAIVSAIRYLDPEKEINTISFIAEDKALSEESWIDIVNQAMKGKENKIKASQKEMISDLDDMILKQGEPFGGTSIYAQYRVFKAAKEKNIDTCLDGQGADELLAGYMGYPGHKLLSLIETKGLLTACKYAKKWSKLPGASFKLAWMYFFNLKLPDFLYKFARKNMGRNNLPAWLNIECLNKNKVTFLFKREKPLKRNKGNRVKEVLLSCLKRRGLSSLLRHGERNSSGFSVESRQPFLSIPLAEYLLSLPEHYLISNEGETKHVFREAMKGIMPEVILKRKDKIGFETPEKSWFEAISHEIEKIINETPEIDFINSTEIIKELQEIKSKTKKYNAVVWRWLNYLKWYNLIIRKNDKNY